MTLQNAAEVGTVIQAPFPWFGGKARIAADVWARLGDTPNYVEPFGGSLAVLLARPDEHAWWDRIETVNDADGFISNFWRAVQADPDAVAHHADWPVNENDLHARHAWLVSRTGELVAALEGDPGYYDARIAGWWVWGLCSWIGSGWCSGVGPWHVVDGLLVNTGAPGGIKRQWPHLNAGMGINRQLPHLGAGMGINRKLPHLGAGKGINRQHDTAGPDGVAEEWSEHLRAMMARLSDRLRRVRVASGDWTRVCGPSPTTKHGLTAVFLDPPYAHAERDEALYRVEMTIADGVREWAIAHGDDPLMRIALCGYDGEHAMPDNWTALRWKAQGGYANQGNGRGLDNAHRETVWFSPHCLTGEPATAQLALL